jgi:hypothetical protein
MTLFFVPESKQEAVALKIWKPRYSNENKSDDRCVTELRGNILLFVKTRPFRKCDGAHLELSIQVCPDGESMSSLDGGKDAFKI